MSGLLHLYSGNGKGKTTAATGLAVRALGRGWPVLFAHFLKGKFAGEDKILCGLGATVLLIENNQAPWDREKEDLQADARAMVKQINQEILRLKPKLLICDELCGVLSLGLLDEKTAQEFLSALPDELEVVITGRGAPSWLIERADYYTEMTLHKHPFNNGVAAREGIEF